MENIYGRYAKVVASISFLLSMACQLSAYTVGDIYLTEDTTLTDDHYGEIYIQDQGNLTLDCNGFTVASTIWVINCSNVVVKNGLRFEGGTGVFVQGSTDITVTNMEITESWGGGIRLDDTHGSLISNNQIKHKSSSGIRLAHSNYNDIIGNKCIEIYGRGISMQYSEYNLISDNIVLGSQLHGFIVKDYSNYNYFENNISVHNSDNGFHQYKSSHNTYIGNVSNMNAVYGFVNGGDASGNAYTENYACGNVLGPSIDYTPEGACSTITYSFENCSEPPEIYDNTIIPALVVPANTPITIQATLDDIDNGAHDIAYAEYYIGGWGQYDWIPMTPADGYFDSPLETVKADLLSTWYPGVYEVRIRGCDAEYIFSDTVSMLLVVYDPEGGFVTGGGQILSPAGAYKLDESATGLATFGFVSKYKKGASIPTGSTEFQFRAAGLNFHSNEYDWLLVTGGQTAKFKGTGTINGEGSYKFMVWASAPKFDEYDNKYFRIRIWEEDELGTETDIYDNGMLQVIEKGNIVIHAK